MRIGREVSGKPSNGSRASRIYYQEQANTYSESSNLEKSFKYEILQSTNSHTPLGETTRPRPFDAPR